MEVSLFVWFAIDEVLEPGSTTKCYYLVYKKAMVVLHYDYYIK